MFQKSLAKFITVVNIHLYIKSNDINLLAIYFESQSQM